MLCNVDALFAAVLFCMRQKRYPLEAWCCQDLQSMHNCRLTANSRCTSAPHSMLSSLLRNTQAGTERQIPQSVFSPSLLCKCVHSWSLHSWSRNNRLVSGHWRGILWCSRVVVTNWEQYTGQACWAFAPNSHQKVLQSAKQNGMYILVVMLRTCGNCVEVSTLNSNWMLQQLHNNLSSSTHWANGSRTDMTSTGVKYLFHGITSSLWPLLVTDHQQDTLCFSWPGDRLIVRTDGGVQWKQECMGAHGTWWEQDML